MNLNIQPISFREACEFVRKYHRGVSWDKGHNKWRACIKISGRQKRLGDFNTAEAASEAYNKAAEELFGEFAPR
jgi:hypothetical protein